MPAEPEELNEATVQARIGDFLFATLPNRRFFEHYDIPNIDKIPEYIPSFVTSTVHQKAQEDDFGRDPYDLKINFFDKRPIIIEAKVAKNGVLVGARNTQAKALQQMERFGCQVWICYNDSIEFPTKRDFDFKTWTNKLLVCTVDEYADCSKEGGSKTPKPWGTFEKLLADWFIVPNPTEYNPDLARLAYDGRVLNALYDIYFASTKLPPTIKGLTCGKEVLAYNQDEFRLLSKIVSRCKIPPNASHQMILDSVLTTLHELTPEAGKEHRRILTEEANAKMQARKLNSRIQ